MSVQVEASYLAGGVSDLTRCRNKRLAIAAVNDVLHQANMLAVIFDNAVSAAVGGLVYQDPGDFFLTDRTVGIGRSRVKSQVLVDAIRHRADLGVGGCQAAFLPLVVEGIQLQPLCYGIVGIAAICQGQRIRKTQALLFAAYQHLILQFQIGVCIDLAAAAVAILLSRAAVA